jgi:hypothetical protein
MPVTIIREAKEEEEARFAVHRDERDTLTKHVRAAGMSFLK